MRRESQMFELDLMTTEKDVVIARLEKEIEKLKAITGEEKVKEEKELPEKLIFRHDPNCCDGRSSFMYM